MSRTIERSERMSQLLALKCHHKDIAMLKLAAQAAGTNVSQLVRQALIKQGLIDPI